MIFDSKEQRAFFAELLAKSTYPGHLVQFVAEQMSAVEQAGVETDAIHRDQRGRGVTVPGVATGDDPTAPITEAPGGQTVSP